jgi:mannose-6-phosphate isomerase-like protein (cupin superfamily)
MTLPREYDVLAPDGSEVRVLLARPGGSMAHFRLPAGEASRAVRHRTVDELWYVLSGEGEMWLGGDVVPLSAGVCVAIPAGLAFQFRAFGGAALCAVAVTMPPWPGEQEAELVVGAWAGQG